ncbi:peroxide stress protein YaaA, partial [Lishizhenia sp.]|uniref:peroxide stress protein YaaA n=1 Tax=Lishizhenia sp. TaxID=2497594 RepID=UPI00299E9DAB
MKILISPAKSLDYNRNVDTPFQTIPQFLEEADYLANKLGKFSAKKFEKMMHISKDLGELNYQRYQAWEKPNTLNDNVKPAATVFTGEVYRGLDIESFSSEELTKAQGELRIL